MKKNKNIITLFIVMVSFFIGIYNVNAVTCTYGQGMGDDFESYFQIKITGYNEYTIAYDKSDKIIPIVGGQDYLKPASGDQEFDFYIDSFESATCTATVPLFGWELWDYDCSTETRITYTLALHATPDVYEIEKDTCPPKIRYCSQVFSDSYGKELIDKWFKDDSIDSTMNYFGYKDGMTGDDTERGYWWWIYEFETEPECYTLKEISLKDEEVDPDEPLNATDCSTYESYRQVLQADARSGGGCEDNEQFTKHYRDLLELCDKYSSSSDYTSDGQAKACMTACSGIRDDVATICGYDYGKTVTEKCNTFGERTLAWIFKIINMVRYLVPVILIILGVLDFIKTIATEDEGEIKKSGTRFVKRLIAAALIFLVPLILQFVLNIFNLPGLDPNNPFCVL